MSRRLVQGVGVNDADYTVTIRETVGYVNGKRIQRLVWMCPYYAVWADMLMRAYSKKFKTKHSTYEDCSACEEWSLFSNFKSWMEEQDWEGKVLDKDILVRGNKIYSPETCAFVSQEVNKFISESDASRGDWPIGVCWDKAMQKFMAQISNPFTKKNENLGHYLCSNEAHIMWLKRKLEFAKRLAERQDDNRISKVLIERYENYDQ